MPAAAAAAGRGACSPLLFFMVPWVVLSTFNVGFGISELNPLQRVLTCRAGQAPHGWLPDCFALSESGFGMLTALFTLGGLISSLLLSPLRARFALSRRATLLAAAIVGALGAALQALAGSVAALGAGRALMGMGAGVGVAVVPGYLNDISPPALRGPIGIANQLSIVLGILLGQTLGVSPLGSAPAETSASRAPGFARWRIVPLFSLAVQLLQLLGASLACESPADAPPHKQAELRARLGHDDGAAEEEEEEALLPSQPGAPAPQGKALEMSALLRIMLGGGKDVREQETRRGVVLIMGTLVAQQLSGVNAVLYYSSSIMADALGGGDNEHNAKLIALGITVVNALMTFPPMYLISEARLGRRGLLLSSSSSMALASLALGLGILRAVPWLSAVALVAVVAGFSVGLGPVPFLILPELVEPRAASAAASLGISLNWAANLVIASLFLPLRSWCAQHDGGSGGSVFFLFSAINAATTAFVARLYRYTPPQPPRRE